MYAGETQDILSTNSTAHAIVLYPHVTGTISFAEVVFEVKLHSKEANPAPKITTYMLYSGSRIDVSTTLSMNEKLEQQAELDLLGAPPDKLVCLSKNVTSLTSAGTLLEPVTAANFAISSAISFGGCKS